LEAAQWTFNSKELQEIVARAIRLSAQESFIRLLPIETLDQKLDEESRRLESCKAEAEAKYRTQVQRRTTLLQTLNSHNIYSLPSDKERDGPGFLATIGNLTSQLSVATAACDTLTETLVRIENQQAQIEKLRDLHSCSALAIALRKLNASYVRRTNELQLAKTRIDELGHELEDAWRETENMAKECDDVRAAAAQFDDNQTELASMMTESAEVTAVTGNAIAMRATFVPEVPESVSISSHSITSHQSRSRETHRVAAAKKRSKQLSAANLRFPKRRDSRESVPPSPMQVLAPPPVPYATKPRHATFVDPPINRKATSSSPRHRHRPSSSFGMTRPTLTFSLSY
jgi:hypothetical protein